MAANLRRRPSRLKRLTVRAVMSTFPRAGGTPTSVVVPAWPPLRLAVNRRRCQCDRQAVQTRIGCSPRPLGAQLTDALMADNDPSFGREVLHVAEAEMEPKVQPDGMSDDLGWNAAAPIKRPVSELDNGHQPRLIAHRSTRQTPPILPLTGVQIQHRSRQPQEVLITGEDSGPIPPGAQGIVRQHAPDGSARGCDVLAREAVGGFDRQLIQAVATEWHPRSGGRFAGEPASSRTFNRSGRCRGTLGRAGPVSHRV
jgi:hypothetical protein